MRNISESRVWPYKPHTSIIASILILVVLVVLLIFLQNTINWPKEKSEANIILGILLFSLLPVMLALVDVFVQRGGIIEFKGVKLNFSQVPQIAAGGFTVPTNIGVPAQAVSDIDTTQILDALREASACDVVIIDLKDGRAWWETRLLVLMAGAVRHQRPHKVVFVGTDGGMESKFQGWGYVDDLLRCLLLADPKYLRSYHIARAAGRQWQLVEPLSPVDPAIFPQKPVQPPWMQPGLATQHPWMAFDDKGLPNDLFTEQVLAADLGAKMESQGESKCITLVRMEELFRPVLHRQFIDENWQSEKQAQAFFDNKDEYIATTRNNVYKTLISKVDVYQSILRDLVER